MKELHTAYEQELAAHQARRCKTLETASAKQLFEPEKSPELSTDGVSFQFFGENGPSSPALNSPYERSRTPSYDPSPPSLAAETVSSAMLPPVARKPRRLSLSKRPVPFHAGQQCL